MNNISEVRFAEQPIKICKNDCGGIERICINDVCNALNRKGLFKDGTAVRKCPSVKILDENHPREIYAEFDETIHFIQWMCTESKMLAPTGRQLLELLQESCMISPVSPQPGPDSPPPTEEVMELEYTGNKFTMKMCDGRYMVNATEMSRPFEKRPNVWLKSAEAIRVRQGLVDDGVSKDLESQVIATRGPYGATWLEIHLWVHFAQWLSPAFASWCSKKMVTLMQEGEVRMSDEPTPNRNESSIYDEFEVVDYSLLPMPSNFNEALVVVKDQYETIQRQGTFIKSNAHKYRHYKKTVEDQEWFTTTMIATELKISPPQLNTFLKEENVQHKFQDEWIIHQPYLHLRCTHLYEWFNPKTEYTNKYKIKAWSPQGREFIIELWHQKNDYLWKR